MLIYCTHKEHRFKIAGNKNKTYFEHYQNLYLLIISVNIAMNSRPVSEVTKKKKKQEISEQNVYYAFELSLRHGHLDACFLNKLIAQH